LYVFCFNDCQYLRPHSVRWDDQWIMTWKVRARKRSWPNLRSWTVAFVWRGWRKPQTSSVRIACIRAEIWTRYLRNTKLVSLQLNVDFRCLLSFFIIFLLFLLLLLQLAIFPHGCVQYPNGLMCCY
jgi:hypothetical protein